MGIDCNSLKNPEAEFRKVGKEFFKPDFKSSFTKVVAVMAPKLMHILGLKVVGEFSNKFFLEAYKQVLEFREENDIDKRDIMSSLIKVKNELNDNITFNDLAAQAFVFFLAGFETSSATMSFFLYEMCKNQEVQNKVRQEILKELEKNEGNITYDLIMDMPYLDCAVKGKKKTYTVNTIICNILFPKYD